MISQSMKRFALSAVLVATVSFSACQASDPAAPPIVTPTLTLSRSKVPLGAPIDMTYKFVVADDAKIASNYRVMVHFGDQDEMLMYTDDHDPPTPTSSWKPGQTIEYSRTFFTPVYPYIGEATIEIGMYAPNEKLRMPMAGPGVTDTGHRSYRIAKIQLLPQTDGVQTIYQSGFHPVEGATANGAGWHWTKKNATFAVRNPRKDCVFYLDVDDPGTFLNMPQEITVSLAGTVLDQFTVNPKVAVLRKIPISAAAWGSSDNVELGISVDKTFVPDIVSASGRDLRELGIRIMHAAIVPQ
jgi:hypothetical protein